MEKGNSSLRERLLARLPEPENREVYREETAALMARYDRALFWEKVTARTLMLIGLVLFIMANSTWSWWPKLGTNEKIVFEVMAAVFYFLGAIYQVGYEVSRSKVDLMKEVKQVQLQVLELHASLRKEAAGQ
jgi:hypothetical protein